MDGKKQDASLILALITGGLALILTLSGCRIGPGLTHSGSFPSLEGNAGTRVIRDTDGGAKGKANEDGNRE